MTRYAPVIRFPEDKKSIKALFITDLHYPHNDRAFIRKHFQMPYDIIFLGGDITEGTTLSSPGACVNSHSENDAIKRFQEDLELIPPSTHIEIVEGNHDIRAAAKAGHDITLLEAICSQYKLGFSKNHTILPFTVGESAFKVLMTHGAGGGSTEQTIIRNLEQVRDAIDATCDLYICGHYHKYLWLQKDLRGSIFTRNKLALFTQHQTFAASGSPAIWENSYAEGTPKNRPYRSCAVKGLEIEFFDRPGSRGKKSIQHKALY